MTGFGAVEGQPHGCVPGQTREMKKAATGGPLRYEKPSHHAFRGTVVMLRDTVLVLDHLAVEFVNQLVYGCVQVLVCALRKQVVAFDVNIAFSSLPFVFFFLIFNGQQHFDIDHLIEMPVDSIELARDVLTQGRRHFQMVSADG